MGAKLWVDREVSPGLARQHYREPGALTIDAVCLRNGGVIPETHRPRLVPRALFAFHEVERTQHGTGAGT